MILRPLFADDLRNAPPGPAADVFLNSQKNVRAPYAIILQHDHSKLAGELLAAVHTSAFGDLRPEVVEAAAQHDFGWNESDSAQLRALPDRKLSPFPDLSAEENLQSWDRSLAHAARVDVLVEVLVSRHFCALGAGDEQRDPWVQRENARRSEIERKLPFTPEDLERWNGAVGFCDLLSLYLCSGLRRPVEFPLAHPASPQAEKAPKLKLEWADGSPKFDRGVIKPGTQVSVSTQIYGTAGSDLTPQPFSWTFANA
jgi:hypothetical protein